MLFRRVATAVAYLALACFCTWPATVEIGSAVPGSQRTDLWNSLWSYWFVTHCLREGGVPYRTTLLDSPQGGTILVSDPLGALAATPLVLTIGVAAAYTLVVILRLAWAGWVAHHFAEDFLRHAAGCEAGVASRAAWIAGVGYASAPVLLSAVHNGTSEAVDGGWAALAAWTCWRAARLGGARRVGLAGLSLLLAALANWYSAVVAFTFAGALALVPGPGRWAEGLSRRLAVVVLGVILVAPVAWAFQQASTGPDNLVGIKNAREVHLVRRTIGPADPVGYFAPGDYRSPDFRELSKYGEGFFHCHYLGYVLLFGALAGLRSRRRGTGFLWLAALAGFTLSLGPVLARHGLAVIVLGDRAIPLPYLLVERLPGLSSLSLLYRLAQAPALAVAVLASVGTARLPRWGTPLVLAAMLLEGRFASPLGALPDTVPALPAPAVKALAAAPGGAVMNFPVAGGRAYLFEQTVHEKPVAGTLNFPNNTASRRVWKAMLGAVEEPPEAFLAAAAKAARPLGIRYVVVHIDPMARPDMHDQAVRALKAASEPLAGTEGTGAGDDPTGTTVRVYALW